MLLSNTSFWSGFEFLSSTKYVGPGLKILYQNQFIIKNMNLQVVYQEVASPEKLYRVFMLGMLCLHFVVAKPNQVLHFVPSVPGHALYFVEG